MMKRKVRAGSTLVALGLALSACGGDSTTGAPPTPTIDAAALDSGNYPTTTIDLEPTRVPTSGALREAIKIGAATPVAFQFDPRFVFARGHRGGGRHVTPADGVYFSGSGLEADDFHATIPGVVAGWTSAAARRDQSLAGREVNTVTLRFETANQAAFAASELSNRTPGNPFSIPGYPDALAKLEDKREPLPVQNLRVWLVRDDMLLFIDVYDPIGLPYDPDSDAETARQFFDKHIEMLGSYAPTPVTDIADLPLDAEGLLNRTLPSEASQRPSRGTSASAVYPAQAILHFVGEPVPMSAAYADAGVDYVSADAATVYRAGDEAAARRLLAALENETLSDPEFMRVESPPNMPTARCFDAKPEEKYPSAKPTCHGVNGRYAFEVSGPNMQEAFQKAAAQHKLLDGNS